MSHVLLLQLSDVAIGGATVFPQLGLGVFPQKGSAIFWYNLHANGTVDHRTLHGACPVFVGSKWGRLLPRMKTCSVKQYLENVINLNLSSKRFSWKQMDS